RIRRRKTTASNLAELTKQFEATIKGVRAAGAERLNRLRRPAFLLSGLLTCGCCGGKYGIVVNDTAVLVISAKGSAAMAVLFAVTTLSSACWRGSPTSWCLPRQWRSQCAPMRRRPIARTMSDERKEKRTAAPLRRLRGVSKGSWTLELRLA